MKAITPEQMTILINNSYNKIPMVNKNSPGIILPPPSPLSEWVKTLKIRNSNDPEIHSDFYDWTIHSRITLLEDENNPEDGFFVRMRAYGWLDSSYADYDYDNIYLSFWGEDWDINTDDGWYYYMYPLLPGCDTPEVNIRIDDRTSDDFSYYPPYTDTNNYIIKIAIFYEITIIFYDEKGQIYADWSLNEALRPLDFAIPDYIKLTGDFLPEEDYPIKNIYRFSNCEFYNITMINEKDSEGPLDWEAETSYFGGEEGFKYGLARISFNDFSHSDEGGAE